MKIFVVEGGTGEYSDTRTWVVKAFRDEEEAEVFVRHATEWANDTYKTKSYRNPNLKSPYDPYFMMDHTGTEYWIVEVELT